MAAPTCSSRTIRPTHRLRRAASPRPGSTTWKTDVKSGSGRRSGRWISTSDFLSPAPGGDGVGTGRPWLPVTAAPAAAELQEERRPPVITSSSAAPGPLETRTPEHQAD
ncbi:unnamed protein product [Pleuronectes platessa]|uniref:Uncharacterized protein n=1 Tax=Pleuronectes platessa TaxID=8262 RepID=A0A9N7UCY3_PLEPL|nr:unnamed protein product [Pleuronectes platessa]